MAAIRSSVLYRILVTIGVAATFPAPSLRDARDDLDGIPSGRHQQLRARARRSHQEDLTLLLKPSVTHSANRVCVSSRCSSRHQDVGTIGITESCRFP